MTKNKHFVHPLCFRMTIFVPKMKQAIFIFYILRKKTEQKIAKNMKILISFLKSPKRTVENIYGYNRFVVLRSLQIPFY